MCGSCKFGWSARSVSRALPAPVHAGKRAEGSTEVLDLAFRSILWSLFRPYQEFEKEQIVEDWPCLPLSSWETWWVFPGRMQPLAHAGSISRFTSTGSRIRLMGITGSGRPPLRLLRLPLPPLVPFKSCPKLRCHLSDKFGCFSYNLPRCQARSAGSLSRINWCDIDTEALEACFAL